LPGQTPREITELEPLLDGARFVAARARRPQVQRLELSRIPLSRNLSPAHRLALRALVVCGRRPGVDGDEFGKAADLEDGYEYGVCNEVDVVGAGEQGVDR
jgi:hypothetical protein